MKKVFVRCDDIRQVDDRLLRLVEMLGRFDIPVHYSVVPGSVTWKAAQLLVSQEHAEIGQHGYLHSNHGEARKYEFGPLRSYQEQYRDVLTGKTVMAEMFGERFAPVFTPPYSAFNQTTVKVLRRLGFKVISGWGEHVKGSGLRFVPACLDVCERKWEIKPKERLAEEFESSDDVAGILVHHEFLDRGSVKALGEFISWVLTRDAGFYSIMDIAEGK